MPNFKLGAVGGLGGGASTITANPQNHSKVARNAPILRFGFKDLWAVLAIENKKSGLKPAENQYRSAWCLGPDLNRHVIANTGF